jgi:hypothetical protein
MTWAVGGGGGESASNALEFGYKLDSLVHAHIADNINMLFRLALDLQECNHCISQGVSVIIIFLMSTDLPFYHGP